MEIDSLRTGLNRLLALHHDEEASQDDVVFATFDYIREAHTVGQMLLREGRFPELQRCLHLCRLAFGDLIHDASAAPATPAAPDTDGSTSKRAFVLEAATATGAVDAAHTAEGDQYTTATPPLSPSKPKSRMPAMPAVYPAIRDEEDLRVFEALASRTEQLQSQLRAAQRVRRGRDTAFYLDKLGLGNVEGEGEEEEEEEEANRNSTYPSDERNMESNIEFIRRQLRRLPRPAPMTFPRTLPCVSAASPLSASREEDAPGSSSCPPLPPKRRSPRRPEQHKGRSSRVSLPSVGRRGVCAKARGSSSSSTAFLRTRPGARGAVALPALQPPEPGIDGSDRSHLNYWKRGRGLPPLVTAGKMFFQHRDKAHLAGSRRTLSSITAGDGTVYSDSESSDDGGLRAVEMVYGNLRDDGAPLYCQPVPKEATLRSPSSASSLSSSSSSMWDPAASAGSPSLLRLTSPVVVIVEGDENLVRDEGRGPSIDSAAPPARGILADRGALHESTKTTHRSAVAVATLPGLQLSPPPTSNPLSVTPTSTNGSQARTCSGLSRGDKSAAQGATARCYAAPEPPRRHGGAARMFTPEPRGPSSPPRVSGTKFAAAGIAFPLPEMRTAVDGAAFNGADGVCAAPATIRVSSASMSSPSAMLYGMSTSSFMPVASPSFSTLASLLSQPASKSPRVSVQAPPYATEAARAMRAARHTASFVAASFKAQRYRTAQALHSCNVVALSRLHYSAREAAMTALTAQQTALLVGIPASKRKTSASIDSASSESSFSATNPGEGSAMLPTPLQSCAANSPSTLCISRDEESVVPSEDAREPTGMEDSEGCLRPSALFHLSSKAEQELRAVRATAEQRLNSAMATVQQMETRWLEQQQQLQLQLASRVPRARLLDLAEWRRHRTPRKERREGGERVGHRRHRHTLHRTGSSAVYPREGSLDAHTPLKLSPQGRSTISTPVANAALSTMTIEEEIMPTEEPRKPLTTDGSTPFCSVRDCGIEDTPIIATGALSPATQNSATRRSLLNPSTETVTCGLMGSAKDASPLPSAQPSFAAETPQDLVLKRDMVPIGMLGDSLSTFGEPPAALTDSIEGRVIMVARGSRSVALPTGEEVTSSDAAAKWTSDNNTALPDTVEAMRVVATVVPLPDRWEGGEGHEQDMGAARPSTSLSDKRTTSSFFTYHPVVDQLVRARRAAATEVSQSLRSPEAEKCGLRSGSGVDEKVGVLEGWRRTLAVMREADEVATPTAAQASSQHIRSETISQREALVTSAEGSSFFVQVGHAPMASHLLRDDAQRGRHGIHSITDDMQACRTQRVVCEALSEASKNALRNDLARPARKAVTADATASPAIFGLPDVLVQAEDGEAVPAQGIAPRHPATAALKMAGASLLSRANTTRTLSINANARPPAASSNRSADTTAAAEVFGILSAVHRISDALLSLKDWTVVAPDVLARSLPLSVRTVRLQRWWLRQMSIRLYRQRRRAVEAHLVEQACRDAAAIRLQSVVRACRARQIRAHRAAACAVMIEHRVANEKAVLRNGDVSAEGAGGAVVLPRMTSVLDSFGGSHSTYPMRMSNRSFSPKSAGIRGGTFSSSVTPLLLSPMRRAHSVNTARLCPTDGMPRIDHGADSYSISMDQSVSVFFRSARAAVAPTAISDTTEAAPMRNDGSSNLLSIFPTSITAASKVKKGCDPKRSSSAILSVDSTAAATTSTFPTEAALTPGQASSEPEVDWGLKENAARRIWHWYHRCRIQRETDRFCRDVEIFNAVLARRAPLEAIRATLCGAAPPPPERAAKVERHLSEEKHTASVHEVSVMSPFPSPLTVALSHDSSCRDVLATSTPLECEKDSEEGAALQELLERCSGDVYARHLQRRLAARRGGDYKTPLERVSLSALQSVLKAREEQAEQQRQRVEREQRRRVEQQQRREHQMLEATKTVQRCGRGFKWRRWLRERQLKLLRRTEDPQLRLLSRSKMGGFYNSGLLSSSATGAAATAMISQDEQCIRLAGGENVAAHLLLRLQQDHPAWFGVVTDTTSAEWLKAHCTSDQLVAVGVIGVFMATFASRAEVYGRYRNACAKRIQDAWKAFKTKRSARARWHRPRIATKRTGLTTISGA